MRSSRGALARIYIRKFRSRVMIVLSMSFQPGHSKEYFEISPEKSKYREISRNIKRNRRNFVPQRIFFLIILMRMIGNVWFWVKYHHPTTRCQKILVHHFWTATAVLLFLKTCMYFLRRAFDLLDENFLGTRIVRSYYILRVSLANVSSVFFFFFSDFA